MTIPTPRCILDIENPSPSLSRYKRLYGIVYGIPKTTGILFTHPLDQRSDRSIPSFSISRIFNSRDLEPDPILQPAISQRLDPSLDRQLDPDKDQAGDPDGDQSIRRSNHHNLQPSPEPHRSPAKDLSRGQTSRRSSRTAVDSSKSSQHGSTKKNLERIENDRKSIESHGFECDRKINDSKRTKVQGGGGKTHDGSRFSPRRPPLAVSPFSLSSPRLCLSRLSRLSIVLHRPRDLSTQSYNAKLQLKVTTQSYNSKLQGEGEGEGEGERERERENVETGSLSGLFPRRLRSRSKSQLREIPRKSRSDNIYYVPLSGSRYHEDPRTKDLRGSPSTSGSPLFALKGNGDARSSSLTFETSSPSSSRTIKAGEGRERKDKGDRAGKRQDLEDRGQNRGKIRNGDSKRVKFLLRALDPCFSVVSL